MFKFFLSENVCSYILEMTNKKLEQYLKDHPQVSLKARYLNNFILTELYAFLGLLILTGVFRANREPISELYSEDPNKGKPIFNKATMPRERFRNFLRFLRFDDHNTRLDRIKSDKLAPIRHIFEIIRSSLCNSYHPGTYTTIDERLCRYRGNCSFRQCMPKKPDRYGIKIWILADA